MNRLGFHLWSDPVNSRCGRRCFAMCSGSAHRVDRIRAASSVGPKDANHTGFVRSPHARRRVRPQSYRTPTVLMASWPCGLAIPVGGAADRDPAADGRDRGRSARSAPTGGAPTSSRGKPTGRHCPTRPPVGPPPTTTRPSGARSGASSTSTIAPMIVGSSTNSTSPSCWTFRS